MDNVRSQFDCHARSQAAQHQGRLCEPDQLDATSARIRKAKSETTLGDCESSASSTHFFELSAQDGIRFTVGYTLRTVLGLYVWTILGFAAL